MEIVTRKKLRNEKIKPRSPMIQTLLYPDFRRSAERDLCTGVTFLLLNTDIRSNNRPRICIPSGVKYRATIDRHHKYHIYHIPYIAGDIITGVSSVMIPIFTVGNRKGCKKHPEFLTARYFTT